MPNVIVDTKMKHAKRIKLLEEINVMRESLELRALEHGKLECLGCRKMFYSYDKINERMCFPCRKNDLIAAAY